MGLRNGSLVCDHCSSTVFAFESFQIAWAAKDSSDSNAGFSYTTQTWEEIDVGENKGCNWCDILRGEIPFWYQHRKKKDCPMPEETFKITVRFQKQNSEDHIVLRVIVEDDWPATYQVQCDPDDNAAAFVPGRKLVWQVASPWAFKLASDCLVQCTLRHHCPKARETSLPTRVVDCSNPERPRLVLTKGMQGFYAALSYVWGEPQPHSTCTTKLSTYLEAIDVLLLPRTIKDAIVCTHNLNLRYLWTDSLCTLQDSDEDKQREIPHMCDIYRDAYVTIIAASSQKVSEGFLHDRKRPVETPLPFWCPDGRLGTISVDEFERTGQDKEPVNLRAWLSVPDGNERHRRHLELSSFDGLPDMMMSRTPCSTPSSDDVRTLLAAWEDVLRDYTQRAVSYPSDRLVAISGIAELFQRWWGSSNRYIAGLWERNLSTDLLWYRQQPSQGRPVTGQYLAPSWSWAATIGRVVAGSDTKGSARNILWDVQLCEAISVSDNHPLGQVKGGKLTVRAIVKDATWDPTEPELFELKQPCLSVEKMNDNLPGEHNTSELEMAPAPAAEMDETTIGAGLAIEKEQIKNANHTELTPVSPVEHADTETYQNGMGLKLRNIGRSFITNLFPKLVPCLRHRKNAHATGIDENAPTKRPASPSQTSGNDIANGNHVQAEAVPSDVHDNSINMAIVVASTRESKTINVLASVACEREPDHIESTGFSKVCQSSEVQVVAASSKVQERHIGYVYFDYDENGQGVGADKGKAVIVGSDNSENPGHLTGLVVVPAVSAGEFRRVGKFEIDGRFYEDDEAPYCDIKSWLDTPTAVITIV
ncbi:hypothetical protein AZE42_09774 [Rhizopogon vesiculosus]|uniref:Heterokaryon incompatibility domain-containing protein n=1 Tax=Rhizopogon vesiculosus TaxID=180088 RepID=A0A1J8QE59_9AGAM|nr:hypothetical protein AZE42_09774 [Rhizopogon vesiculosus]